MENDEGWWFLAVKGFWFMIDEQTNGQTDERTDICECRVAFVIENKKFIMDIGFGRMEQPKNAFQWL